MFLGVRYKSSVVRYIGLDYLVNAVLTDLLMYDHVCLLYTETCSMACNVYCTVMMQSLSNGRTLVSDNLKIAYQFCCRS